MICKTDNIKRKLNRSDTAPDTQHYTLAKASLRRGYS